MLAVACSGWKPSLAASRDCDTTVAVFSYSCSGAMITYWGRVGSVGFLDVAGVPARTAAELAGVNRNTAILYFHKLREIIATKLAEEAPFLDGEIEVDSDFDLLCEPCWYVEPKIPNK